MTKEEAKKLILEINSSGFRYGYASVIRNRYPDLYKMILSLTIGLDKFNPSFMERVYCFYNDINDRPKCCVCHDNYVVRFFNGKNSNILEGKYGKWCSIKCSRNDSNTEQKIKLTKVERYGDVNYHNLKQMQETKLKRYGNEHYTNIEKIKQTKLERYNLGAYRYMAEKIKQTKLNKYGDSSYNNMKQIHQTKLERYGDENYNNGKQISLTKQEFSIEKNNKINEKRRKTNLERNGYEYFLQTDEGKEHYKEIYKEKTGFESPLNSNSPGRIKGNKTRYEKYGTYNNVEKIAISTRKNFYNNILSKNSKVEPLFTLDDYIIPHDKYMHFRWRCKTCYNEFESKIYYGKDADIIARCPLCYPIEGHSTSIDEKEIVNYIRSIYNGKIIENDRRSIYPLEIDILLPELNIGIEYNGTYWHSDIFKPDPYYHLNKTKNAETKGIHLYQIFEYEWKNNKDLVRKLIRGFIERKTIKGTVISPLEYSEFKNLLLENSEMQSLKGISYFKILSDNNEPISFGTFTRVNEKEQTFIKVNLFSINNFIVDVNDISFKEKIKEFIYNTINVKSNEKILLSFDRRYFSGLDYKIYKETTPRKITVDKYSFYDCGNFYIEI